MREGVEHALAGVDDQARGSAQRQPSEGSDSVVLKQQGSRPCIGASEKESGCRWHVCLLIIAALGSLMLLNVFGSRFAPAEASAQADAPKAAMAPLFPTARRETDEVTAEATEAPLMSALDVKGHEGTNRDSLQKEDEDEETGNMIDDKQQERSMSAPPLAGDGLCCSSAPVPEATPPRKWRLDPSWQSVCAKKWFSDEEHAHDYPQRNWCWVGYKAECHQRLKEYLPWESFQKTGGSSGSTVPREIGPYDPLLRPELCDKREAGRAPHFNQAELAVAQAWFEENVAVFVLNLEADKKRWDSISARLKSLRINATRIAGVDMRRNGSLKLAKVAGWVPFDYNFTAAQEASYSYKQQMGSVLGTLGCASGHFKAQEAAVASGAPLAVVFEDDVRPEADFVVRLWSLVAKELPCDWNVVSLYSRCPYGRCVSEHLLRVEKDENEPAWGCHHGVSWGMQGILYRVGTLRSVQAVWKPTVFDETRPRCMDVDVALAAISDRIAYYAVPSVQDPGFLREMDQGSARWDINMGSQSFLEFP